MQFFDRIKLFGMPAKHQPDLIYLRYVPLWKVHIFTVVQLTCLVLLWVIKASAAAVVFPMMVSFLFYKFIVFQERMHHPESLRNVFAALRGESERNKAARSTSCSFLKRKDFLFPQNKQFSCKYLLKVEFI